MPALLDVMAVRATGDPTAAVVECAEPDRRIEDRTCDVLVVGGGTVERIVVDRATFLARAGVPAG